MSYVRDIADISDFVAEVPEISADSIEGEKRSGVAKVHFVIYCRSAYIHAYLSRMEWLKNLFFSGERVGDVNRVFFVQFHGKKSAQNTNNTLSFLRKIFL